MSKTPAKTGSQGSQGTEKPGILALEVTGLRKVYGRVTALDGVDLRVPTGAIFGLVGPNGAGKTTLIKALVGALRPTEGSIRVLGLEPLADKWAMRRQIGYMPQLPALYDDLSARANITFFSQAQNVSDLPHKVEEILAFTELTSRADDPVSTFSGGMKRRVSLACALVHRPRILLLDEPTAAVDPHLRFKTWELFRSLAERGVTLLVSTHLMDEALLCDRVVVLHRGLVIADDRPAHILEAGRSRLAVHQAGQVDEQIIPATPEALAVGLQKYGLDRDIEAVDVAPETLEDVILTIIRDRGVT